MRIVVLGLWHLGCVTAACVASAGHAVTGVDLDSDVIRGLQRGAPPIDEPGLAERIRAQVAEGRLRFTAEPDEAIRDAELLWLTFDTPVNERDEADIDWV